MIDEAFSKYYSMKDSGATKDQVFRQARKDGLDSVVLFRMIRAVYALSMKETKELFYFSEEV